MAVLLGRTTAGASPDFSASGHTAAWPFAAVASGQVTKLFAQTQLANASSTGHRLAIYANSAGLPTTRLGVASVTIGTPTGTGVFGAVLPTPVTVVASTTYWLAWYALDPDTQFNFNGTTFGSYQETNAAADCLDPFGTSSTSSFDAIIWGEDSPGGSPPPPRVFPLRLARQHRPGRAFLRFPPPSSPSSTTVIFNQALDANATATASFQKTVAKTVTATATSTSSFQKTVLTLLSSSATSTATIATLRSVTLTLTATATATATMTRTVLKRLSASATSTATISRTVAKALTASATATATMSRTVLKLLTATATSTASLVAQKVKLVALTANATATATMSRVVSKTLSASSTSTATLRRSVALTLSAGSTATATIQKTVSKTLSATASATATLVATFVAGGGVAVRLFRTLMGVGK